MGVVKPTSIQLGTCRWLFLDDVDRLIELGFEDTIKGIIQGLDVRRKLTFQAIQEGKTFEVGIGTGRDGRFLTETGRHHSDTAAVGKEKAKYLPASKYAATTSTEVFTPPSFERETNFPRPAPSHRPSFALCEAPKMITGENKISSASRGRGSRRAKSTKQRDISNAEQRMQNIVRA
ncbi:hypothetical protein EDB19DRAFT_2041920 [Suillus lakei]|nr:hypothetical protein EDB19DRAFT_2041920 [Suillus lakei]